MLVPAIFPLRHAKKDVLINLPKPLGEVENILQPDTFPLTRLSRMRKLGLLTHDDSAIEDYKKGRAVADLPWFATKRERLVNPS